jgi:hypothetical protein
LRENISEITNRKYTGLFPDNAADPVAGGNEQLRYIAFRVVADHARCLTALKRMGRYAELLMKDAGIIFAEARIAGGRCGLDSSI